MTPPLWRYERIDSGMGEHSYLIYRNDVQMAYSEQESFAMVMVQALNRDEDHPCQCKCKKEEPVTVDVKEYLEEHYPDFPNLIVFDDLDAAFLGVGEVFGIPRICYDSEKILQVLMERDGMTREEATEFFEFNIAQLYAGPRTPIILYGAKDA